jgi:hypothetical protein
MAKQTKTEFELKCILDERIGRLGPLDGAQWTKIVRVDPPKDGANWTVSHHGAPGGFAVAIDKVQDQMKKEFDLA